MGDNGGNTFGPVLCCSLVFSSIARFFVLVELVIADGATTAAKLSSISVFSIYFINQLWYFRSFRSLIFGLFVCFTLGFSIYS
ncbi:hypothetical protein BVRB_7g162320 [Beta vulgaris subsp. vulgaris]|nr:hypothetical protein BVRB_7g162320 [Beta vulgaris subsp. vulgaris]